MTRRSQRPFRRIGGIDVAASLLARVAPQALSPTIDQLRRDARSLVDGLFGAREPSFSTLSSPTRRPRPLGEIDPVLELLPRSFRRPYSTLRGDVEMVLRELRGERPPPIVARPRRSAATHGAPDAIARTGVGIETMHRARIVSIVRETADATTLVLEPIAGPPIVFEAGQFLGVEVEIDGRRIRRAYSISSAPHDGTIAITCKRIAGGLASTFLCERLREGDVVGLRGPSGSFVVPRGVRRVVLIAGGSGITPCWSIARDLLARHEGARVTLIDGNRAGRDVIFGAAIEALAARDPRFEVLHVLSDPESAPGIAPVRARGTLEAATLSQLGIERAIEDAEIFVCGPPAMTDAVSSWLGEQGVDRARIHVERFHTAAPPAGAAPDVGGAPQRVTLLRRGGSERALEVEVASGSTVLEAALAAGVAMPFSCAVGGCGACKVRIVEGDIAMDEPSCLSRDERAAGWTLTCVGRPTRTTTLEIP